MQRQGGNGSCIFCNDLARQKVKITLLQPETEVEHIFTCDICAQIYDGERGLAFGRTPEEQAEWEKGWSKPKGREYDPMVELFGRNPDSDRRVFHS
jgi:hypothetical protein